MTTWEPATDADKDLIHSLLRQLRAKNLPLPPLPKTANLPTLDQLTKRDAGTLTTALREALMAR